MMAVAMAGACKVAKDVCKELQYVVFSPVSQVL